PRRPRCITTRSITDRVFATTPQDAILDGKSVMVSYFHHRSGPLEQAIERVGVLRYAVEMAVAIRCYADGRVPHPPAERIEIHAGRDIQRGIGMAQIVEA